MALKELEARFAKPRSRPFKMGDGGGLFLLVQPNGSKLWQMKCRFNGKEKLLSFGKYPGVSLSAARAKRDAAKAKLAEGIDPSGRVQNDPNDLQASCRSFETVARDWHLNREAGLDPAHAQRVLARLERDVFPQLGNRPLSDIKASQILEVIRAVEARGALDVSRRLKQGVSQIYRYAIANGWAEDDPTIHLLGALKPRPRVRHMPRVALTELRDLVRAIEAYDGDEGPRRREVTRLALLFTLLSWARTGEVRFAVWNEFEGLDGPEPLWRIPADRMKMDREHIVPLSPACVEVLRTMRSISPGNFVFPGVKEGRELSANTMIYACYRMGYRGRQTVHGFRGLASTWANEAELYKSEWIEMALAHADENAVRGAYNAALYLTSRRRMLGDWGRLVMSSLSEKYIASSGPKASATSPRMRGSVTKLPVRIEKPRTSGSADNTSSYWPYWQRR